MEGSSAATTGADILSAALASYHGDKLFELTELDELLKQDNPTLANLRKRVEAETIIPKLRSEYAEAVKVTHEMKSDEGWSLVKDSGNIRTYYRQTAGTPIHSVRIIADLDAPLLHLLVLIAEADLYKVWVPFMEDSREIVGAGYRKIVYVKVGLPWPFEPRDSCCYGYTVDRLAEEGSILVVMRDPVASDPLQLPTAIPAKPKTVRMIFHLGGLLLRPLGDKTRMYMIGNVDPQLAKAKNIDSTPHAERLRVTKKAFYDEVKRRLEKGIERGADEGHPGRSHHALHKHEHNAAGEKATNKTEEEAGKAKHVSSEAHGNNSDSAMRASKERATARNLLLDID